MPAKKAPPPKPQSDRNELGLIRDLADLLNETGLSEIELEQTGIRVRVSRGGTIYAAAPALAPPSTLSAAAPVSAAPAQPATPAVPADAVKSPMVGTVYRGPQP
jgi:acetyl-CoA carboxylase biotin carboxyl carrier protein